MWEKYVEDYRDPKTGAVFAKVSGIKRDDGFILMTHRMDPDYFQTFVCRIANDEFKFLARRWQGKPLETYTVYVTLDPDHGFLDRATRRCLFHKHAKDIEEGLLVYPLGRILDSPVRQVLFNVSPQPSVPELVTAEDV